MKKNIKEFIPIGILNIVGIISIIYISTTYKNYNCLWFFNL